MGIGLILLFGANSSSLMINDFLPWDVISALDVFGKIDVKTGKTDRGTFAIVWKLKWKDLETLYLAKP